MRLSRCKCQGSRRRTRPPTLTASAPPTLSLAPAARFVSLTAYLQVAQRRADTTIGEFHTDELTTCFSRNSTINLLLCNSSNIENGYARGELMRETHPCENSSFLFRLRWYNKQLLLLLHSYRSFLHAPSGLICSFLGTFQHGGGLGPYSFGSQSPENTSGVGWTSLYATSSTNSGRSGW